MMANKSRLDRKLFRAFGLQLVLISCVAISGVFIADFAIREVLIVSALEREAEYFWARHNIDKDTPAPNTNTLIGYLFNRQSSEIPSEFSGFNSGIYDFQTAVGSGVVHVSERNGKSLYLVFDATNVGELATYFGILPLAFLLVILYSSAWIAFILIRRAVSPVILLARSVENVNLDRLKLTEFVRDLGERRLDSEIKVLVNALEGLLERVDRSIDRERTFTREASHELRTPITVLKIATSTLKRNQQLSVDSLLSLSRIERAVKDMEELTEVLLLLARDYEGAVEKELVCVNEIVAQEINSCKLIYQDRNYELLLEEISVLRVESTQKIVAIILGNLIRNACAYTDSGVIRVEIDSCSVTIVDSGIGIEKKQLEKILSSKGVPEGVKGNGIGLMLVKRIAEKFNWKLEISSQLNEGTIVSVRMREDAL